MNEKEDTGWAEIGPFISKTLDQQAARRAAERSVPRASDNVEKTFTAAPMRTLASDPPLGGRSTGESNTTEVEAAQGTSGAFSGQYTDDDGHTFLQGGTVTGGGRTTTIPDIKLLDAVTGIESTEGFHLYVKCVGDGVVANGLLFGGWEMTSDAIVLDAASTPNNTLPTAADETGKLFHVSLGVFTADAFLPSASGDIAVTFCPNGYNPPR